MTELLAVDPSLPQPERLARAADCLRRGGLVAFPTETVYGLGVHALDREAVRRLFAAKGRPATDPLIVHVPSLDLARALVTGLPPAALALGARFWPGPLTLVLPRASVVPDDVTAGLGTVAVRVPAHPVARALLEAAGIPVAAPSANLFSRPSPTSAAHVLADLDGRIDMVIDGGPSQVGVESTVLDLSRDVPTVLRHGAVTIEMLRALLPEVQAQVEMRPDTAAGREAGDAREAMPSPGMLSTHYAPRTPLTLYRGDPARAQAALSAAASELSANGLRVIAIAFAETAAGLREIGAGLSTPVAVVEVGSLHNMDMVAQRLYAALREADALQGDIILMRDIGEGDGLAAAIRDRLQRAAAHIRQT